MDSIVRTTHKISRTIVPQQAMEFFFSFLPFLLGRILLDACIRRVERVRVK